jgi:hypothetical protein
MAIEEPGDGRPVPCPEALLLETLRQDAGGEGSDRPSLRSRVVPAGRRRRGQVRRERASRLPGLLSRRRAVRGRRRLPRDPHQHHRKRPQRGCQALPDILPGARVVPWRPVPSKLSGKPAQALAFIGACLTGPRTRPPLFLQRRQGPRRLPRPVQLQSHHPAPRGVFAGAPGCRDRRGRRAKGFCVEGH